MNKLTLGRFTTWLFPAAVLAAAVLRVEGVPAQIPEGSGNPASHARIVNEVLTAEPGFRREALTTFPGDLWSQSDHFAARESLLVERLAKEEKMRIGAVLDVIDRDVKAGGDSARGRVAPCMPRPFYE